MNDLPLGFTMALSENEPALRRFAGLSRGAACGGLSAKRIALRFFTDDARALVIAQARQASSREEMQAIVQSLT